MKKFTSAIALVIFSHSCLLAQDKATFYTDNGNKAVSGELDCATLKDLLVKTPISANAFKYDKIEVVIQAYTHEKVPGTNTDEFFSYGITYLQKKFSIQFEGKNEISLWVCKPNDGDGDFGFSDGGAFADGVKIRTSELCGATTKEKVDVKFVMYAFIQTGEKDIYDESKSTWIKVQTYDEGTLLSEGSVTIKQTPENIKAAKKAKKKKALGF